MQAWGVQHLPSTRGPEPSIPAPIPPDPGDPLPLLSGEMEKPPEVPTVSPPPPAHSIASQPIVEIPVPGEPLHNTLSHLSLAELETLAKGCTQCRLHQARTHVVFGVGNPHAELMFAGEAPGRVVGDLFGLQ